MNIKISIALITYNGEKYICDQLDSILRQTIQNFEVVICDDCSTDSTKYILMEYAKKDSRFVLNFNDKNLGFLKNLEKAIKLCKGEYLALADQDDIWEENHLSVLYSNIKDNFLICGDTLCVDERNNSLNIRYSELYGMEVNTLKNNEEHLLRLLIMPNIFQGATMMFSRKFIDIVLPFPSKIEYHDWWFALCAMALNKFSYIPIVLIRHRRHHSNASGHIKPVKDAFFHPKMEYAMALVNIPCLSENSKNIIEQSNLFFLNREELSKCHKTIKFWIKNYHILYATNTKNRFLIRFSNFLGEGVKIKLRKIFHVFLKSYGNKN